MKTRFVNKHPPAIILIAMQPAEDHNQSKRHLKAVHGATTEMADKMDMVVHEVVEYRGTQFSLQYRTMAERQQQVQSIFNASSS